MNQAALVLAVFSIISQLCGLLRDRLLASLVGPSPILDTYYASFRIPDFLYVSFASLFAVTVLIPFITEHIKKRDAGDHGPLRHFMDNMFTSYAIGMIGICIIAYVLMPLLVHLVAPGFTGLQKATLQTFSRTMLLSPFLFGLSNLFGAFAQVQKKFFSFAIAPVFYNLGILIGVVVFRQWWGMYGVIIGVLLGAFLHLCLQIPALVELRSLPRFIKKIDWDLIRKVLRLSIPRTLTLSLTNISFIIISALASFLAVGSISLFQLSYNIQTTPLMVIGISFAVAAFPTLSKLFAEDKKTEFRDLIEDATRSIHFFALPIIALTIVLRAHIVRLLLGSGVFSWNDTRLAAACLSCFIISISAQSMILLFVRAFYAMGDTKTPLKINTISLGISTVSALLLMFVFSKSEVFRLFVARLLRVGDLRYVGILALPLAFSIGQLSNGFGLWYVLAKRHMLRTSAIKNAILSHGGASILGALAAYGTLALLGPGINNAHVIGILIQTVLATIVGLAVYGTGLYFIKNEQLLGCLKLAKRTFWKPKSIQIVPQQQDL